MCAQASFKSTNHSESIRAREGRKEVLKETIPSQERQREGAKVDGVGAQGSALLHPGVLQGIRGPGEKGPASRYTYTVSSFPSFMEDLINVSLQVPKGLCGGQNYN